MQTVLLGLILKTEEHRRKNASLPQKPYLRGNMMLVRDLLKKKDKNVFVIRPDSTIAEAVRMLNEKHIGALIVQDPESRVLGIITERDILSRFDSLKTESEVSVIMTPAADLIIVHETDTVDYAMAIFTINKIRHLPVFENEKLIGLISIGDAVKAVLSEQQAENRYLQDYISGAFSVP